MIKIKIKDTRSCSIKTYGERVRKGDNRITSLLIEMPECFGEYNRGSCSVAMKCHVTEGVITYNLRTDSSTASVPITTDITDRKQVVRIDFVITHSGNVIGSTNTVKLEVLDAPDNGEPLTPREQFDAVIREQRVTIAEQVETITEQASTIASQSGQITELSGEVDALTVENEQQAQTIARQNTTIDQLNSRVPPLEVLEPINPSQTQRTYTPESPNIGFPQVVVNAPTAEGLGFDYDYLKEGVKFLGGTGTYNPFPEHSYGGIYYTELGENDYPKRILIKDVKRAYNPFPVFFNTSNDAIRELREFVFENCTGVTSLAQNYFNGFNYLQSVVLPSGVTSIGQYAFYNCSSLQTINIPSGVTSIGNSALQNCSSLQTINLPSGVTTLGIRTFYGCSSLRTINLPSTITNTDYYTFGDCRSLQFVTIENGFNCNGLNVSFSTHFTAETIVACLEALANRTGQTAYTITFGTTNLNKLTAEQKAIAINKNWNLA